MLAITAQRLVRHLAFFRRNLAACPQDVKESAYKERVHPVLEYGSSVLDPKVCSFKMNLRRCRKGHRFVTSNYTYETWSMTGILEQLQYESMKKRRKDSRLIMLYKGLKPVYP